MLQKHFRWLRLIEALVELVIATMASHVIRWGLIVIFCTLHVDLSVQESRSSSFSEPVEDCADQQISCSNVISNLKDTCCNVPTTMILESDFKKCDDQDQIIGAGTNLLAIDSYSRTTILSCIFKNLDLMKNKVIDYTSVAASFSGNVDKLWRPVVQAGVLNCSQETPNLDLFMACLTKYLYMNCSENYKNEKKKDEKCCDNFEVLPSCDPKELTLTKDPNMFSSVPDTEDDATETIVIKSTQTLISAPSSIGSEKIQTISSTGIINPSTATDFIASSMTSVSSSATLSVTETQETIISKQYLTARNSANQRRPTTPPPPPTTTSITTPTTTLNSEGDKKNEAKLILDKIKTIGKKKADGKKTTKARIISNVLSNAKSGSKGGTRGPTVTPITPVKKGVDKSSSVSSSGTVKPGSTTKGGKEQKKNILAG